ncbi:MAG TPA: beta galactosidase jelly roll domain-containing protein, partial [Roseimicrobium sp.]|nr:beta galactosidase jelly roll domain-containing protein [Roseimicrobium sp.]
MEHTLGFTVAEPSELARERLLMDFDWKFAFGHATDVSKDFNHATGQFSYLAKAGLGSGASARGFDDSGWRKLDLPHDWAAALPISKRSHKSHSFRTLGRNFPETSVGWYRKTFSVPESDLGKRISVEFDGVYRDSIVWINGHYLGGETSGYSGFARNISELLNYGGENVIAVRVDASLEEGWFYEGAGIYRHVWLVKTAPLHVERHGTYVTSEITGADAEVKARVSVVNGALAPATFDIEQVILDGLGQPVATARTTQLRVPASGQGEYGQTFSVPNALLWSIEKPHLHTLVTTVCVGGEEVDRYETT